MSDRAFEVLETKERVIEDNDRVAAEVRKELKKNKTFLINLMASPGAGKTTTLCRTINALKDRYKIGVMEADVDDEIPPTSIVREFIGGNTFYR